MVALNLSMLQASCFLPGIILFLLNGILFLRGKKMNSFLKYIDFSHNEKASHVHLIAYLYLICLIMSTDQKNHLVATLGPLIKLPVNRP